MDDRIQAADTRTWLRRALRNLRGFSINAWTQRPKSTFKSEMRVITVAVLTVCLIGGIAWLALMGLIMFLVHMSALTLVITGGILVAGFFAWLFKN